MTGPGVPDLAPESAAAVEALGSVEIAVAAHVSGERGAGRALEAVATGLELHFPGRRTALLVAGAGSRDGAGDTVRAWLGTRRPPAGCLLEFGGRGGRGGAMLGLLATAQSLGAQACGLIDADLGGVTPAWIERLLGPVAAGDADCVLPAYTHAVADGTLTTNLLAPLTRALYGRRIQQVAGGCAGLGGALVARCLGALPPAGDWSTHGIEIWVTTEAAASGARLAETHLGRRLVEPSVTQPDVATTVVRTVGPLLALMECHRAVWQDVRGSVAVPLLGDRPAILVDAAGPGRVERLVRAFKLGLKDLLPVWEQIMPEATLARLYPLGLLGDEEFRLPPFLWAGIVSDFAVAYHERRLPHDHLLRALTPLYLGRVAAFTLEARATPAVRMPDVMEAIGRAFEVEKETLAVRWR